MEQFQETVTVSLVGGTVAGTRRTISAGLVIAGPALVLGVRFDPTEAQTWAGDPAASIRPAFIVNGSPAIVSEAAPVLAAGDLDVQIAGESLGIERTASLAVLLDSESEPAPEATAGALTITVFGFRLN